MKLLEDWQKSFLTPILVNLISALALFALALLLKPFVLDLFGVKAEVSTYPLICTAEPVSGPTSHELATNFFIVNRTDEEYSREQLNEMLTALNPDEAVPLSPDIELRYSRSVGRVAEAEADEAFNDEKGRLSVERSADGKLVRIVLHSIAPRAILKVRMLIEDLPPLAASVNKRTLGAIPLNVRDYMDECYSST